MPARRLGRARLVGTPLAVLLTVALAGCNDEPAAPAPFTTSPSPTVSDTPTADPPATETPTQFVRRWVRVQNEMEASGDTAQFLDISHDCDYCDSFARRIGAIYQKGGWVKTDGWKIVTIGRASKLPGRELSMDFFVDSSSTRYVETAEGPVKQLSGSRGIRYRIQLRPFDEGWRATFLGQVAQ